MTLWKEGEHYGMYASITSSITGFIISDLELRAFAWEIHFIFSKSVNRPEVHFDWHEDPLDLLFQYLKVLMDHPYVDFRDETWVSVCKAIFQQAKDLYKKLIKQVPSDLRRSAFKQYHICINSADCFFFRRKQKLFNL